METTNTPLTALQGRDDFIYQHLGSDSTDQQHMLATLGFSCLEELITKAIPANVLDTSPLPLPYAINESAALAELRAMASINKRLVCMYGCGYHPTNLPAVLQRNLLENPNWYTAYTPYQAEISQGRLELLLNFQQMIIELTGLPVAGASLLDESTAAAEALSMARAVNRSKSNQVFVHNALHPQTLAVLQTRTAPLGVELVGFDSELPSGEAFAMLVQYPDTCGALGNPEQLVQAARARKITPIAITDPLALMLLACPANLGFAIAVGSTQRFGVPMSFGGPHAAYLACEEALKRVMPGRLIGVSKDARGNYALRMALQTREQHIRREKATSNICTAQVLLANLAVLFAMHHGQSGMLRMALRVHRMTRLLASASKSCGLKYTNNDFFDTLCFTLGVYKAKAIAEALLAHELLVRTDGDKLLISCNDNTTFSHLDRIINAFGGQQQNWEKLDANLPDAIPPKLTRFSVPLGHRIFTSYRNETVLMRYLKRLQDKDITLTHSMIPLGSCTMKLNAASELLALSWPQFGDIHPFAPQSTTQGYLKLINSLEQKLCALSGFAAVSLQPNSGAQGEYAGLLAIRRYHQARGDSQRDLCLIPSSAHGTNPASAVMAGMKVKVVACDAAGNVDLDDLQTQLAANSARLGALMITYPSTHGVFEEKICTICDLVHQHGGMVYMDGANTNALIGLARPPKIGADVMHFNLHKTFCIPHGGGGPGVGPIGLVEELAPYMPGHPVSDGGQPVAAAPYGSAHILAISWMYIRMMGRQGLRLATEVALLNANYIAHRLAAHYPLLYTGPSGLVAHECIIDIRQIKEECGITEEDIAKRLMDYGFHSPTMSFPVTGTLMIEPTESESLQEIDRFCDALIAIRQEIHQVATGVWNTADNPLKQAPHTMQDITEEWKRPYSREQACFPLPYVKGHKFWPAVKRIDNVYGDRHLVCSCDAIEEYANES